MSKSFHEKSILNSDIHLKRCSLSLFIGVIKEYDKFNKYKYFLKNSFRIVAYRQKICEFETVENKIYGPKSLHVLKTEVILGFFVIYPK